MADGIRIQPQRARLAEIGDPAGRLIIVRDVSRPIPPSPHNPTCSICGWQHECKTYHLQLDADGTVMVSTTIWERLQTLYDHGGFETVNVVSKPPNQTLLLPSASICADPARM